VATKVRQPNDFKVNLIVLQLVLSFGGACALNTALTVKGGLKILLQQMQAIARMFSSTKRMMSITFRERYC